MGPVVPAGYQVTGMLGPAPTNAGMPTREQLQAQIQARTGTTGPQYGGAGLGAQNPIVPEGYVQQGRRMLSPSVQAAQAAQQSAQGPVMPGMTTMTPGQSSEARQAQMYQDILDQRQQTLDMANRPPADIKQQVINGMLAVGQPYTGGGTWSADGRSYTPSKTEIGIGTMGKVGPGNLLDASARSWGNQLGQMDKLNEAANKFAVTPDVLKRMVGNPELTQQFYSGAKSISPKFNTQVSDNLDRQRKAYEAYMAPLNARNAAKLRSVPGFFGSAGNLGNIVKGMNPLAGVQRIASGEGKPTDYLKLAKFFL